MSGESTAAIEGGASQGDDVPVLVIAYKRPDRLKQCLTRLVEIGVKRVYVAIDGPRGSADEAKVAATRDLVSSYPGTFIVAKRFADQNYGCRAWVSSSISWFFEAVEFGIIVEEDILIDRRFYAWCQEVRDRFAIDEAIMHVNAFYPASDEVPERGVHLTKWATSWGWATWRRAWKHYDDTMTSFLGRGWLEQLVYLRSRIGAGWPVAIHYFLALHMTAQAKLSSWAYRWNLSIWERGGYALSPGINLSENQGVDENATHTGKSSNLLSYRIREASRLQAASIAPSDAALDAKVFHSVSRSHDLLRTLRVLVSTIVPTSTYRYIRKQVRG